MSFSQEDKFRIIQYFHKHGLKETLEAVSLSDQSQKLSKTTLYRWIKTYTESYENLDSLRDKSRKPRHYRQSCIPLTILRLIQQFRFLHPGLGERKLKLLIDQELATLPIKIKTVSHATIGRALKQLRLSGKLPKEEVYLHGGTGKLKLRVKRKKPAKIRRNGLAAQNPGFIVQVDAITVLIQGKKRYLVCGVDLKTRYAWAMAFTSLSSSTAKEFLLYAQSKFPFPITHIQTDNGQEYHKHFDHYLADQGIIHFWNYPRSPKMNCYVERFNRTVQEEFVNQYLILLRNDPAGINRQLEQYLTWYNTKRPHTSLDYLTPEKFFQNVS